MSIFKPAIFRLNHDHERLVAPIVADGAIGTGGIGDGRIIPLVILDTSQRSDIDAAIEAQASVHQGDVKVQWGQLPGHDHTVALYLTLQRPAEACVIVEFDLTKNQGVLVENILASRGLYIQAGRPGDRLKHDVNRPKLLAEVPDTGFRPAWDRLYFDYTVKAFRARGLPRPAAKQAARAAIREIRKIVSIRPAFATCED